MSSSTDKREPLSKPLNQPPPGAIPCLPTLFLGLPHFVLEEMSLVLQNDLLYSSTSEWNKNLPADIKLDILENLDAEDHIKVTQAKGGSIIVTEDELYTNDGTVRSECLNALRSPQDERRYQAIVTEDSSMIREPAVASFVAEQYHVHGVSVVVMAVEGIFDLSPLNERFGTDWRLAAYTKRVIELTEMGLKIISSDAFPFDKKYVKSLFISTRASEALFAENINPDDYEDSDPIPQPSPGSAIVTHLEGTKSISYFGFVNSLDVSYGAIVLRLCYAADHANPEQAIQAARAAAKTRRQQEQKNLQTALTSTAGSSGLDSGIIMMLLTMTLFVVLIVWVFVRRLGGAGKGEELMLDLNVEPQQEL